MADQSTSAFMTVLGYSIFIILAPISTFFIAKILVFQGMFHTDSVTTNVWSAVAAVVVLHIALGMYIYKAYGTAKDVPSKPSKTTKPTKVD